MHRHGPHILGIIKGLLLGLSLLLAVRLGHAGDLHQSLINHLHAFRWAVIPAYWLIIMIGAFVLTFPLTLMQDHLARSSGGHHEETPAGFWLRGLSMETAVGTVIGCVTTYLMAYWSPYWWITWTAIWSFYHVIVTRAPLMNAAANEEELPPHPELLPELNPLLETSGHKLERVFVLPDPEDDWESDHDLVLHHGDHGYTAYIPHPWILKWRTDEIAAVILHKAWLTRSRYERMDLVVNATTSLACFGLFAAIPISLDPLFHATLLFAWTVVFMPVFQVPALAYFRHTLLVADEMVARLMQTPDALIRVLERATHDYPADADTPTWAERLFHNTPTLARRIAHMKQTSSRGVAP